MKLALCFLFATCVVQGADAREKMLRMFTWANYMAPEVLVDFKRETGIEVRLDYFASNEELLAKLRAGATGYDIVVPSDFYVQVFRKQKLLRPLDLKLLPNRKNLEVGFQDPPYDRGNEYSVPYFWGTTGLGINKKYVKESIDSWGCMFDPRYRRKLNVLDDMREVIGIALHYKGHSINTRDPVELEEARQLLRKQKEILRTYNASTFREILAAGDVWITQAYSGDMVQLRREDPNIGYVIPKEGATIYTDSLAIPVGSKNVAEAHQFMNYILRPDVAEKLARELLFATPNREARAKLPPEIRDDPAIYPPPSVVEKLEYIGDVGPALEKYEEIWIDVKTL